MFILEKLLQVLSVKNCIKLAQLNKNSYFYI